MDWAIPLSPISTSFWPSGKTLQASIAPKTAAFGVSADKVIINIERYGNTTNGTIPLCLWEWENKFKKGDNLILAAFGGGFTWGSIYLKWAY